MDGWKDGRGSLVRWAMDVAKRMDVRKHDLGIRH